MNEFNVFMAITNIFGFIPLHKTIVMKDFITASCLLYVITFSFLSHLVENHKNNGMRGIGYTTNVSIILNRFDISGCVIVFFRFLYLYINTFGISLNFFQEHSQFTFWLLIAFICNKISEKTSNLLFYIIFHSLWHLLIFMLMSIFLEFT